MKKMNLIYIFFIFLFICVKNKYNNETEFDLNKFVDELVDLICKNITAIEKFGEIWKEIPYRSKNIFYQNIDLIKNKCFGKHMPNNCKLLFDILGIL